MVTLSLLPRVPNSNGKYEATYDEKYEMKFMTKFTLKVAAHKQSCDQGVKIDTSV